MTDTIIQLITKFFIDHWRRIAFLALLFCLIFVFIRLFFSYAVITVTVDSSQVGDKQQPRIFIYRENTETDELGNPGLHIIPRDAKSILATTDNNIRTQSPITIPWYGYVDKKVTLHRDKNAEKIAFNSTLSNTCTTYSKKLDRMMQYDCNKPTALVYYDAPQDKEWSIQTVSNSLPYRNGQVVSYMGGVLGNTYIDGPSSDAPGFISYINENGVEHLYQNPDGVDAALLGQARLFTDVTNQENSRFVLVEKNGVIHLGTPPQDKNDTSVSYTTIPAPAGYNTTLEQTMCQVSGDTATCYRGLALDIGDTSDDTSKIQPEIVTLHFGSTKETIAKLKDDSLFSDLAVTDDGQLYGLSFKKLVQFIKKGDVYVSEEISQNVDAIASRDTLYFLQDDGVFTVDPNTHDAYQVFYSHNIKPDQLVSSGGELFAIGKSANNTENLYAWKLNNEYDIDYSNRLIDILPSFPASSLYGTTDLVGQTLNIQLLINRSDSQTDIQKKRQATLDYLNELGINTNQLAIVGL